MPSSEQLLAQLELFGIRLGLDSTRRLLKELGNPQDLTSVVLVGGTNGKGSTAAMLSSMLSAAGIRAGLYTSPHLERVHERVRVDGRSISEADLATGLARVIGVTETVRSAPVTYFEALTAAALLHFASAGVELAVLEVGLGGRLDATNATEPVLSVITEIGLDHREHLGSTLEEIAVEKAGILRRGRPAVAWIGDRAARRTVEKTAGEIGAALRFASDFCRFESPGEARAALELTTSTARYRLRPPLAGRHQVANLGLAVAAAEELSAAGWPQIDRGAVEAGVAACRWPGRLEWVTTPAGARFLLDGAHNPSAVASLRDFLATSGERFTLVFGALREKQVEEMLPPLANVAESVIVTSLRSPRAIEPELLADLTGERATEVAAGVGHALDAALESGRPVVVTGSLYLVGEMRAELRRRFGVPEPAAELPTHVPSAKR